MKAIFGEREVLSLSWLHWDVIEYYTRWWQLRDTALEIFLMNGTTYLLAFETTRVSDIKKKLKKNKNVSNEALYGTWEIL